MVIRGRRQREQMHESEELKEKVKMEAGSSGGTECYGREAENRDLKAGLLNAVVRFE